MTGFLDHDTEFAPRVQARFALAKLFGREFEPFNPNLAADCTDCRITCRNESV